MKLTLFGEIVKEGLDQIYINRMRSFLTVLGIILGVSSLIVMFSLINAGKQRSLRWMSRWINKVTVSYMPPSRMQKSEKLHSKEFGISYYDYLALKKAHIPGLKELNPTQTTYTQVNTKLNKQETRVVGGTNIYLNDGDYELDKGRYFIDDDETFVDRSVIIGSEIAKNFFRNPNNCVGKFIKISGKNFKVIGVLKKVPGWGKRKNRWTRWINSILVVPLKTMMLRLNGNKKISLSYRVDSVNNMEAINVKVKKAIIARRGVEDFSLENRGEDIQEFQKNQNMWNFILAIIAMISLIVGGIGITNIMLATIKERIREIGLKKAIGATANNIKFQFITESTILALLGGIIGVILGIAFSSLSQMILGLQGNLNLFIILVSLIFSLLVGLISGFYPAVKAGNIPPIDALRYE